MKPMVYGLGDSITWGEADSADPGGFMARALGAANTPFLNLAKPSETGQQIASDPTIRHPRWRLMGTTGKALVMYGTNDLLGGGSHTVPETDMLTIVKMLRRRGLSEVFVCTIPPKCSSTDGFVTVNNQTPQTPPTPQRLLYVDWWLAGAPLDPTTLLRVNVGTSGALVCDAFNAVGTQVVAANTSLHPVEAVFDPGSAVEAAGDRTRWAALHSGDGLHPNATGHAAMAATIDTDRIAA